MISLFQFTNDSLTMKINWKLKMHRRLQGEKSKVHLIKSFLFKSVNGHFLQMNKSLKM